MRTAHKRSILAGGGSLLMAFSFAATVSAQAAAPMFQANLSQLNNSGVSGTANVRLNGNQATVTVNTTGASPNLPHAQHIRIGGNASCPANTRNPLSTTDGQRSYGPISISLTTSGDTAPGSALAVDRMPRADGAGRISYSRTFALPNGVTADSMRNAVIVQHGISKITGDPARYDGEPKSELNNQLPAETTWPAACGKLTAMPMGGVDTGGGSTAGIEHTTLLGAGAGALILSGVVTLAHLRRHAGQTAGQR